MILLKIPLTPWTLLLKHVLQVVPSHSCVIVVSFKHSLCHLLKPFSFIWVSNAWHCCTGVYTHDDSPSNQSMLLTERHCFADLVTGLSSPCPCGMTRVPWTLEDFVQALNVPMRIKLLLMYGSEHCGIVNLVYCLYYFL